jgi:Di-haem oxidoreductase, putative peroxidase
MNRTLTVCWLLSAVVASGQTFHPDIPRAWDDKDVARFQLPLAQRDRSPRYMGSAEYYALKPHTIYRSYPVYAPGREPAGYFESLKQKDPEVTFDASRLRTRDDWIRAGEAVFDAEVGPVIRPAPPGGMTPLLRGVPVLATRDGVVPYAKYVIRQKGVVEVSPLNSCSSCHTRILADGTTLKGAQGNYPFQQSYLLAGGADAIRLLEWTLSAMPWVLSREEFDRVSTDEIVRRYRAIPPGVMERHGTSSTHPSHIPSLIGIQDVKYLDATGLVRHQSIGDLMRYVVANYGLDVIAHYGDFQPVDPTGVPGADTRFSDEQLYALALYIYSLKPPPNPNRFDNIARRGQRVFEQQGCGGCHTPPLYTNNKLNPVEVFQVPDDLRQTGDIMSVSVGTDPGLATQTRRGTGFYKVPSLRGVWYRNAFSHSGQAETLEEWLDPARLHDDYVPKGFHLVPGPIKGHEFGLKLPPEDKNALIAFLNTL